MKDYNYYGTHIVAYGDKLTSPGMPDSIFKQVYGHLTVEFLEELDKKKREHYKEVSVKANAILEQKTILSLLDDTNKKIGNSIISKVLNKRHSRKFAKMKIIQSEKVSEQSYDEKLTIYDVPESGLSFLDRVVKKYNLGTKKFNSIWTEGELYEGASDMTIIMTIGFPITVPLTIALNIFKPVTFPYASLKKIKLEKSVNKLEIILEENGITPTILLEHNIGQNITKVKRLYPNSNFYANSTFRGKRF